MPWEDLPDHSLRGHHVKDDVDGVDPGELLLCWGPPMEEHVVLEKALGLCHITGCCWVPLVSADTSSLSAPNTSD